MIADDNIAHSVIKNYPNSTTAKPLPEIIFGCPQRLVHIVLHLGLQQNIDAKLIETVIEKLAELHSCLFQSVIYVLLELIYLRLFVLSRRLGQLEQPLVCLFDPFLEQSLLSLGFHYQGS